MQKLSRILSVTAFLAVMLFQSFTLTAQDAVRWSTSVKHVESNLYEIVFKAAIQPGFHLYDLGPYEDEYINVTVFTYDPSDSVTPEGGPYHVTQPTRKFDETFGLEIGQFYGTAEFGQKVRLTGKEGSLSGVVNWSVCDDTSCLPPTDTEFKVTVKADRKDIAAASGNEAVISEGGDTEESKSLWSLILEAIVWGLAALVTPCVFPMIPMTVSFFMKGSENKARAKFRATAFGIFIVALYTLPIAIIILTTWIVGGDSVTADIFNWLATHWIPNIIFFLVFMVFAASFFGAFEITMPSKLVNKSDKNADRGGLGGVFFMALTLVLVSFSCTGPLVGTVLIKATSGEFWAPIVAMLAFSITFAIPFTLFAFFPSLMNRMKSGSWLNSVKVVLGFVELALGLKFLSVADQTYHWGILDREIYLALWIAIFTLLGFYLLGKLKFKHDSDLKYISVPRLALSVICFAFVVYLIPGMWGAPLKGLSGYMPPLTTQDFVLGQESANVIMVSPDSNKSTEGLVQPGQGKYSDFLNMPYGLKGFFTYDEGLAYSKAVGKPLFIDFTGHGCVNCREMEQRVWTDATVKKLLQEEFVIVALYADDKKNVAEEDWVTLPSGRIQKNLGRINSAFVTEKYGVNAQPGYIICDNEGNALLPPRGYNLDVQGYIDFLKEGIEAYKKIK